MVSFSRPVLNCSTANKTLLGSELTLIIATPSVSIGTPLLSNDSCVLTSTLIFSSEIRDICSKIGNNYSPTPANHTTF